MRTSTHLTEHFTLGEMTVTTVRPLQRENMLYGRKHAHTLQLTAMMMESVRSLLGVPIIVHSGIRCPELNTLKGGSKTSQHLKGEACDFHPAGLPLHDAFLRIWDAQKEGLLSFGQLIIEDGDDDGEFSWIHLSLGSPHRDPKRCGEVAVVHGDRFEWLQRGS